MATGVLVDANVLYSRTLRDWLFLLRNESNATMFAVWTTVDILAETLYRLRRNQPDAAGHMISKIHDRIASQIDDRIDDFIVDGSYPGPDPDDRHVHAAAATSGAGFLLTSDSGFLNLDDTVRDKIPYEIYDPDAFFVLVDDSAPQVVRSVTARQLAYWMKRDREADLCQALRRAECPRFARRVATHVRSVVEHG